MEPGDDSGHAGDQGLLELVANVSEGRDHAAVSHLAEDSEAEGGARLLDLHLDVDHNRSVLTFAGKRDGAVHTACALLRRCVEQLDMSGHEGVHPRLGALDVCPFVPLDWEHESLGIAAAKTAAHDVAAFSASIGVPVFLYDDASARQTTLPEVRRHSFTKLRPDRGPFHGHPTAGAVAVGVRRPLVAYNMDLETDDIEIARRVAARVRESSGGVPGLRTLALSLPAQDRVQVSMNLVDPATTGIGAAWRAVEEEAARHDTSVVRGELVGLVPRCALRDVTREILRSSGIGAPQILEFRLQASGLRPDTSALRC